MQRIAVGVTANLTCRTKIAKAIGEHYICNLGVPLVANSCNFTLWNFVHLSVLFFMPFTGKEFPTAFEALQRKICRYLFHVLGHIYWAHYRETVAMDLHGHLNTLYTHFIVFIREFNLVDPKETSIMDDLSEVLCTPLPPTENHVTER